VSRTLSILLIATFSSLATGVAAEGRFGSLAKAGLGDLQATSGRGAISSAPTLTVPLADSSSGSVPPAAASATGTSTPSTTGAKSSTGGSGSEQSEINAPGGAVTIVGPGGAFTATNRIADGAFQGARGIVTSIQNVGNNVTIQNVTSVTINFR